MAAIQVWTRIDVTLANDKYFPNWKAGHANVPAGGQYVTSWIGPILDDGTMTGLNRATLFAEDVTPAPYNQPPYPSAGYLDSASCVVEGFSP